MNLLLFLRIYHFSILQMKPPLYVPKGSADAYRASEVFSEFKNIVELEAWQWPTSISTPTIPTDAYKVYGKDGTLHIETIGGAHDPAFVNVYNINGQGCLEGDKCLNVWKFLYHKEYML